MEREISQAEMSVLRPGLNKIASWKALAWAMCLRMLDLSVYPPPSHHLGCFLPCAEVPDGQRFMPGSQGRLWVWKCLFAVFPNQISVR